jgi:hypothetical protein
MANQEDRSGSTANNASDPTNANSGSVRRPQPEAAAQDPHNAAVQDQVRADSEAIRREEERLRASTPNEISEKTVGEIAEEAEQRARR